jgi:hypothetical protein
MGATRPTRGDLGLLVAARSDPDAFGEFYRRHAIAIERWV